MARKSSTTYEPGDEPYRCCAKAKQTGKRCGNDIVPGRRVCKIHGGLGGRVGTGRWTDALGKLGPIFDEIQADEDLTDMTRPLALLSLVVEQRMERVDKKDTPEFRKQARKLYDDARDLAATDPEGAAQAMSDLGKLLRDGVSQDAAIDSLVASVEKYRRALEEFWKIRLARQSVMNERDIISLFAYFMQTAQDELGTDGSAKLLRRLDRELLAGSKKQAKQILLGEQRRGAVPRVP